jgi:hypothetical protein
MINLMWYQIRISAYKPNRLGLTIYLAPEWGPRVQYLLRGHGLDTRLRTNCVLTVREPDMFVKFIRNLDPSVGMEAALARYEVAVHQDVRGQVRSQAVFEEQCAAVRGVLALLPPPGPAKKWQG